MNLFELTLNQPLEPRSGEELFKEKNSFESTLFRNIDPKYI